MAGRATPEGKFKDDIVAELEKLAKLRYPIFWYLPLDDQAGISDIIGVARGKAFLWELKKDTKRTPRQSLFLLEAGNAMGLAASLKLEDHGMVKVVRFHYGGTQKTIVYPTIPMCVGALLPDVPLSYPKGQAAFTVH